MPRTTTVFYEDPESGADVEYGRIIGATFVREVDPEDDLLATRKAYALPDSVINDLVDRGVDFIALEEPGRTLYSAIEDWQDFGQEWSNGFDGFTSLSVGLMGAK